MKLIDLFQVMTVSVPEKFAHNQVINIAVDHRKVVPGSVFVAIQGQTNNGHLYIEQAIAQGALAIVYSDHQFAALSKNYNDIFFCFSEVNRASLEKLSIRFYNDPSAKLYCIGVTGTNGKTSITYLCESIWAASQNHIGVIGTVDHHFKEMRWKTEMTTPDPISLQSRLQDFNANKAYGVVMEVSSHALDQCRVNSVSFDAAIFTNLTRDHLDYHSDMLTYFEAKAKLFEQVLGQSEKKNKIAIINSDDEWGHRIKTAADVKKITYGKNENLNSDNHYQFEIKSINFSGTRFVIKKLNTEFYLPMYGEHNVANASAAIALAYENGIKIEVIQTALKNFNGVPGRLEMVKLPSQKDGPFVFVDYAHTPDALENILISTMKVRENNKSNEKIWIVFGCGGDRDKGKRPLMAAIAEKYADHIMLTSDNPRTEDPQQILNDIKKGIKGILGKWVHSEIDRIKAINEVILKADKQDVILIAGKGHEDYQIIGKTKFPMSDQAEAKTALQLRKGI